MQMLAYLSRDESVVVLRRVMTAASKVLRRCLQYLAADTRDSPALRELWRNLCELRECMSGLVHGGVEEAAIGAVKFLEVVAMSFSKLPEKARRGAVCGAGNVCAH